MRRLLAWKPRGCGVMIGAGHHSDAPAEFCVEEAAVQCEEDEESLTGKVGRQRTGARWRPARHGAPAHHAWGFWKLARALCCPFDQCIASPDDYSSVSSDAV